MDAAITVENVRFCYGEVCAIAGVDIALEPKTLTALVGPNGGGKSTLVKLIAGLLKPDDGCIVYGSSGAVGYVPQTDAFDTSFPITVAEMVQMGTLPQRVTPLLRYSRADRASAAEAIRRVGLRGFEDRGIDQLSGGQLRRAVIARALVSDADIIALDEPDANLDIDAAKALYRVLVALKTDKTIIVASHNVGTILDIADSAVYLNRTAAVYDDPLELNRRLKGGVVI